MQGKDQSVIYACHFPFGLANRITELLVWVSLDPLMTDHEKALPSWLPMG